MAKLLTREKEFVKLNEDLNKISMGIANNSNFQTYTKQKKVINSKPLIRNDLENINDSDDYYGNIEMMESSEDLNEKATNFFKNNLAGRQEKNIDQPNKTTYRNSKEKEIPQNNNEKLIRLLKSKIEILEEDRERIAQQMIQQKEILTQTLQNNKHTNSQLEQAIAKNNLLFEQLKKLENISEESNKLNNERFLENTRLQKELVTAKRSIHNLNQTNASLEKRLTRANEALNASKEAMRNMKSSERECEQSKRINLECKDKQIQNLKKQRLDLLNALKKQLFLIDNLKRQNICLEQTCLTTMSEKEFIKVLNWKKPNFTDK